LGEDSVRIMTQLINSIYKTGELLHDFIQVQMIALKKKPKATKCSDHHMFSLNAHSAKTVAEVRVFGTGVERKIDDVLGDD
jgi:hypothetical protein